MRLLDKLERKFGRFAVPNLTFGIIICQAAVFLLSMSDRDVAEKLMLVPQLVLQGEVWRLFTFLCIPPSYNGQFFGILFAIIFWWLFYMMGTALEMIWGTFRYNVYLLIGFAANVGVAFIFPAQPASNVFLELSVFLAFAYLNPDYELLVFFILPVKVKWLALLTWVVLGVALVRGPWMVRVLTLASVANFIVFFGKDLYQRLHSRQRRARWEARQPERKKKAGREPFHRCEVCGVTDISNPDMTFRYCSKCEGAHCFCTEHIHNHEHITNEKTHQTQEKSSGEPN